MLYGSNNTQLLDSVFVVTVTETLIILDITKTQSNKKVLNKINLTCIHTLQYFQTVMYKVVHCYSQMVKECDFVHLHHH